MRLLRINHVLIMPFRHPGLIKERKVIHSQVSKQTASLYEMKLFCSIALTLFPSYSLPPYLKHNTVVLLCKSNLVYWTTFPRHWDYYHSYSRCSPFTAAITMCTEVHKPQKESSYSKGSTWLRTLSKQTCSLQYIYICFSKPPRGLQQNTKPSQVIF